ncbi:Cu,Zn superoxide dismutase-like protein [Tuber magnatum]|uniref:Superoxide dismutase 1 copper chaperone n=1 Tax=Tuber magnatum TaxID=42249 RepID=A0A317SR15_9PEZI|nr:Cu,Zn superoxide dismutase-like protein [Tuber magnatum]
MILPHNANKKSATHYPLPFEPVLREQETLVLREKTIYRIKPQIHLCIMIDPFQTLFAVPLECDSCVQDVSNSLKKLPGISRVDADLQKQLVTVEGTAAPSAIVSAIQDTGRDAILRGSGKPNSAAVAILETHAKDIPSPVRGLVRIVQVSSKLTILDLTLQGLSPGGYHATIRAAGDISRGAASTGDIWGRQEPGKEEEADVPPRGKLGSINVGKSGTASVLLDKPIEAWEIIGRSFVVSKERDGSFKSGDPDTIVGVIARSAGVWENEKTVCSCSGKTIWDERRENVERGLA